VPSRFVTETVYVAWPFLGIHCMVDGLSVIGGGPAHRTGGTFTTTVACVLLVSRTASVRPVG